MKQLKNYIVPASVLILFLSIFYRWFFPGFLSGGDWPYLYPQAVYEVVPFSTWDILFNNGMGQSSLPKIWFDAYSLLAVKAASIFYWPLFERIFWFFPYVLISFFSSYFLSKKIFQSNNFNLLSGVIYSLNTYILLIVSGGQVGVMMAYAFLPAVFLALLHVFDLPSLKRSLILGLTTAILIVLDLRIGYVYLIAEVLFGVLYLVFHRKQLAQKILYIFILPGVIAGMLHIFWILPILVMGRNPTSQLTDIYTSSSSLSFFSFAKMENAIGLLHPNWPENLFGKVAFLRPEFLLVPILAFSSLLFIQKEKKDKKILLVSVALVGLMGIFLAKGTNEPFGELYTFAFNRLPGFVMFRDPTKWYMLIAVSFSLLIPYTLLHVSELKILRKKNVPFSIVLSLLFLVIWGVFVRDAVVGNVKGTLQPHKIPNQYQSFAKHLSYDSQFYRTLWVPVYPTFAYVSNTHPAVPAIEFFQATSPASLVSVLQQSQTQSILQSASVKYVVVPEDIEGKIFVNDRKYSEKEYQKILSGVEKVSYLKRLNDYGKMVIFEVENPKPHIWSNEKGIVGSFVYVSPTKYTVSIKNAKKRDIVILSETFDPFWQATVGKTHVRSIPYTLTKTQKLNSFILPQDGTYTLTIEYLPQQYLNIGIWISLATLIVIIIIWKKL